MNLIAIDPGKSGGIARCAEYLDGKLDIFTCMSMPDTDGEILEVFSQYRDVGFDTCLIEQVGGYAGGKGQPGSAMFKFGDGFGFIRGVLMALKFKVIYVRPQKWQKHFSLGTASACASKTEWKNKLKAEAQRRFPQLKVTNSTADAILIMEYGRETMR